MKTSVKKLIAITESYPPKITAFALNNACAQLIMVSGRYEHLRKGVNKNAAKLAADFLAESETFFAISEQQENGEKEAEETHSTNEDQVAS